MFKLILYRTIEEYKSNLKVVFSLGLLLAFLFLFVFFEQFFFSSGTVFLSFDFSIISIVGVLLGLIFLYVFSFFVTLIIYSVKRDIQKMDFDIYWNFLMKKSAGRVFVIYFFLVVLVYVISSIGLFFGFVKLTIL